MAFPDSAVPVMIVLRSLMLSSLLSRVNRRHMFLMCPSNTLPPCFLQNDTSLAFLLRLDAPLWFSPSVQRPQLSDD